MHIVNNRKINKFFALEYILCSLIVLSTMLQKSTIASNAFMVSFLILIFYSAKVAFFDRAINYLYNTLLITVFSFISILFSAMINYISLSIEYFSEYFIFLSTILFVFIIMNIEVNLKTVEAILIFNIFVAYLYPFAYRYLPQKNEFAYLSLNFSNPNLTAMWILQSVLYATLSVLIIKAKILKIIAAFSIPINVSLINKTSARNCIVALAAFALLCIWVVLKQKNKFSKIFILIINVIPIAFVPIYLTYINIVQEKGWFDFFVEEGKTLTSRISVWLDRFQKISGSWLIGNYAQARGNAHNAHLVILASYGIITLLLVIYFFYKVCMDINQKSNDRKNLFALAAFFAVIFMGLGEGAVFSGGQGIFVMAFGFLILAKCNYNIDYEKQSMQNYTV